MVYTMTFRVDGGCRNNGRSNAIASAACCRYFNYRAISKRPQTRTEDLPSSPTPTNQRAELTALIIALTWALERYDQLDASPKLQVTITSDSDYAVKCMTEWIHKWRKNGWKNAQKLPVSNKDLVEKAAELEEEIRALGKLKYRWAPREENADADLRCNKALDAQERERE